MAEKIARRGIQIFIDGTPVSNSVKGIRAEMSKLINQQNNMTLGSKEYVAKGKQIAQLKSYMEEHKRSQEKIAKQYGVMGKSAGGFFSKAANGFNKYFALATTFLASITGASLAFRRLAEDVAKMDDVYADVMKTTGLTREEVLKLNDEFKKMDTRTSREDLNLLARDAGKLGIVGTKNIMDFVEAGNQIRVALGEDLGEDAIKNIGKMVGVFQNSTKQLQNIDLKGQMLAVGSAINELGQSSTASEPYLVQFAGRMGGVSKQAKISMADILGFASALDQDMQAVEMSATSLQKFIMKVMGDPAKFAKMAGVEVKAFSDLLSTDANAAIKLVLRSLSEKGGFQQLIPLFQEMGLDGARAVNVISAMAGSIDNIDEAQRVANQAMTDGVSVTNEYNIKNENLAAQLEKARKRFKEVSLELGESLNPILLKSTKGTTYLIRALVELPKWLNHNKAIIITLVATWISYILAVNRAVIATKLMEFWNGKVIVSFKAVGAAIKANPWGLIATGLILALAWLNKYLNKQKDVNKEQAEFLDLAQQSKDLFGDTKSLQERAKAMKSLSKSQLESLQSNLDSQISALEEHDVKIKAMSQKALDEDEALQKLKTKFNNAKTDLERAAFAAPIRWREQQLLEGLAKEFSTNQKSLKQLTKYKGDVEKLLNTKTPPETTPTVDNHDNKYKDAEKALDTTSKIRQLALLEMLNNMQISEELYNQMSEAEMMLSLDEKLKLQKQYGEQTIDTELAIANAKLKISKEDIKRQEEHKKLVDSMTLKDPVTINEEDPIIDTEKYTLALRLKILEAFHNKGLLSEREYVEGIAKLYQGNQQEINQYLTDARLKSNQQDFDQGIIGRKAYLDNSKQITQDYWDEIFADGMQVAEGISAVANAAANVVSTIVEAENTAIDAKYASQLKAAKAAGQDTTEIEEKIEAEKLEIKKKYADLEFGIKAASIIGDTAVAVMKTWAELGPIAGPIVSVLVGAAGIAQLALANQQREQIKNMWTGGFTEPGDKYQPRGVVHAGEFVASQESVNNPYIRPVLNAIDQAQRQGMSSSMKKETIMRAISASGGYAGGGFVESSKNLPGKINSNADLAYMSQMIETMNRLNATLDNGIEARSVISGRNGSFEQTKKYKKLINNASRL